MSAFAKSPRRAVPAQAVAPAAGVAARSNRSVIQQRMDKLGITLVLPMVVVMAVLVLYPSISSIIGSLQHYQLDDTAYDFIGLGNYARILADSQFLLSIGNTLCYLVIITVAVGLLSVGIAVWLNGLSRRSRAICLTLVILPWAVPGTVSGILWSFILQPTGSGLLNSVLLRLHIVQTSIAWIDNPQLAILCIGLTVAWSATPFGVIILLAGLQGIPGDIYEAAQLDGADARRQFFSITLPLLRPSLPIVLVNAAILAIGVFDQVYVLAGFDPGKVTITAQIYMYAFRDFNFGLAFAASVVSTVLTTVMAALYFKVIYQEVEY